MSQNLQARYKCIAHRVQCMLNVIWTLKGCMLFMLARMTSGTTYMKWIRIVAAWVVTGYIAVQIAFFTACRPFKGYWGMPPPDPQCTTLEHYAIVQATFNLSSDVFIIAIPLPMLMSLALPLKQKIGLCVLFSMGTFVVSSSSCQNVASVANVTHLDPRGNPYQSLQSIKCI